MQLFPLLSKSGPESWGYGDVRFASQAVCVVFVTTGDGGDVVKCWIRCEQTATL